MTPSQTFHDHVQELRRRLAWLVLTIGGCAAIGYVFRVPLVRFLQKPLGAPLFYSSPSGGFNFILKVSTTMGLMLALPLIVYHLIRFLEPALPNPVKRSLIVKVIIASTILAAMGLAFGFFVMVPMSLHFFSNYSSATFRPWITGDSYLSFVLGILLTFAALFQIPLLVLFVNRIKPLKPSQLLRYQRHIVVGAFVLAVVLPFTYDPVSQFVMAVPIVFLYYLSILLVYIANRRVVYAPTQPPLVVEDHSAMSVALMKPTTNATPALAAPSTKAAPAVRSNNQSQAVQAWQTTDGGLRPAAELMTAVDVVKPGTISGGPLQLEPAMVAAVVPINPSNVLTLEAPPPAPINPENLLHLTAPAPAPVTSANLLALERVEPTQLKPQNVLKLDPAPLPTPINPYNVLDLGSQP